MIVNTSWVDAVKTRTGITGVSPVWGERPEWYLWLEDAPGVYGLALEGTEPLDGFDRPLQLGLFSLKCYPYKDHPVSAMFSPQERKMLAGGLFDRTNTPRLEARNRIPPAFFAVGSVTLMLDPDETIALMGFESLDALRVRQRPADGGQTVLRDVPGWQIGYPFFDRLACLYAFYRKRPPFFMAGTRGPGFEHLADAAGALACRPCAQLQHLAVSLIFLGADVDKPLAEAIWRTRLDAGSEVVLSNGFHNPSRRPDAMQNDCGMIANPLWWELAETDLKSELGSACGCTHHHSEGTCCPSGGARSAEGL